MTWFGTIEVCQHWLMLWLCVGRQYFVQLFTVAIKMHLQTMGYLIKAPMCSFMAKIMKSCNMSWMPKYLIQTSNLLVEDVMYSFIRHTDGPVTRRGLPRALVMFSLCAVRKHASPGCNHQPTVSSVPVSQANICIWFSYNIPSWH